VRVTTHRDRLTGTWVADDGGQLALALDGRQVTGTVTAGGPDNIARIAHGSFDGQTGALRLIRTSRPRFRSSSRDVSRGVVCTSATRSAAIAAWGSSIRLVHG
jgi:hypothetical protein